MSPYPRLPLLLRRLAELFDSTCGRLVLPGVPGVTDVLHDQLPLLLFTLIWRY